MSYHDGQTTSSTGPHEDWDGYLTSRARLQDTFDARAVWLGYRGEADFADQYTAQAERYRTVPRRLLRHGHFIYVGKEGR